MNLNNITTLKENDLIFVDNRIYKLEYSAYYKRGEGKGRRLILKLLRENDLYQIIFNLLKGGSI